MRASLFSIRPPFLDHREFLYLVAGKKRLPVSTSPPSPFFTINTSLRKPSSQRSVGLYVSASGMCCDTCGHRCVLLHCRPHITHVCVALRGEGRGRVSSPLPPS